MYVWFSESLRCLNRSLTQAKHNRRSPVSVSANAVELKSESECRRYRPSIELWQLRNLFGMNSGVRRAFSIPTESWQILWGTRYHGCPIGQDTQTSGGCLRIAAVRDRRSECRLPALLDGRLRRRSGNRACAANGGKVRIADQHGLRTSPKFFLCVIPTHPFF